MAAPLPDFFPEFKKHHGIYVMRRTYEGTCAFLAGYEFGTDYRVLKDFHAWLVMRGKGRPELYWPLLVLCEIYGDASLPDFRYFTSAQDEEAVAVLFELLDEFFALRRMSGL